MQQRVKRCTRMTFHTAIKSLSLHCLSFELNQGCIFKHALKQTRAYAKKTQANIYFDRKGEDDCVSCYSGHYHAASRSTDHCFSVSDLWIMVTKLLPRRVY